jgi:hypothetical protein
MMGGNIPQQLAQNRMEQLQNQYNTMFPQQNVMMQNQQPQQTQFLKGRPVSSIEEARASMIDLDGTMFVFTDIANNKIYTKQVLLDGTAELKTYVLEEQKQPVVKEQQNVEYVTKQSFDKIINDIKTSIENMKEDLGYADNEHD